MKRVSSRHGGTTPAYEADELRGFTNVSINGVMYYAENAEDQRAKSEAIAEQAEELEMARAELRQYRRALGTLTPEAQFRAALEVTGIDDEDAQRAVEAWRKIQEL